MFDLTSLLFFLGSSVLIILAPGPDIIFTVTQGLSNGKRAGITTAMGLASGNLVHTSAAALGLSVLFKTSPVAFWILKIAGAVYLFYLAYMSIKHRNDSLNISGSVTKKDNLFWRGFLMNIMNPKVALFFIAFLPRFVDPDLGKVMLQFIVLGVIFAFQVVVVFGSAGYFAGTFGEMLREHNNFSRNMNVISAVVFTGIAISLLFF
ncbi:LysE family translocator [Saccharicrinis sp. FJH54]|uniref:LysE family translocator n=1 Tax=Saccharicrinis sp. FJH54 TaxID=3344665 RepID=UPI0035D4484F